MAMKKMFGGPDDDRLSPSEEELLDGVSRGIPKEGPRRKEASRARASKTPVTVSGPAEADDPWGDLEDELSRRIEKPSRGPSVGTRLEEQIRARPAQAAQDLARHEVQNLKEISAKLDQKILESGLHQVQSVEKNVYEVLGIDVDEAALPRDAEQLLILSVRLMRAAKGFTLSRKIREALFCYQKAQVLFDRILELDPGRETTRDMKNLVERFSSILEKRL